jgi:hypothetical protein
MLLAEEQTRPDVARKRARWKAHQSRIAPARFLFIDETWVKTNMAPLRGWGTKRRPLKAYAPHGHWKTLTFIAALRHDRIDAPWVIDGPINGETFLLISRRSSPRPSRPAMSSSWTISAATKAKPPAPSSEPKAPASSFCRPTAPTSHRTGLRQAQTSRSKGSAA